MIVGIVGGVVGNALGTGDVFDVEEDRLNPVEAHNDEKAQVTDLGLHSSLVAAAGICAVAATLDLPLS